MQRLFSNGIITLAANDTQYLDTLVENILTLLENPINYEE